MIIHCPLVYGSFGANILLPTPPMIPAACTCPTNSRAHDEISLLSANDADAEGRGLQTALARRASMTAVCSRVNNVFSATRFRLLYMPCRYSKLLFCSSHPSLLKTAILDPYCFILKLLSVTRGHRPSKSISSKKLTYQSQWCLSLHPKLHLCQELP